MESDDALAAACAGGDERAWETLVRRYHRRVWNVAYRFTGRVEEADELAQDIFVRVLESIDRFEPGGRLEPWILRIARNHCIDDYRRRRRERAATLGEDDVALGLDGQAAPARGAPDPHARLEAAERAARLRRALGGLPRELREAVVLRDLREMTYQEIADALGVPLGTVKSRINRGRLELARRLAPGLDAAEGGPS